MAEQQMTTSFPWGCGDHILGLSVLGYTGSINDSYNRYLLMQKLLATQIRGNFGYPWGCGDYRMGFNLLGEENELAGTYQRRHGRFGPYFARTRYTVEYISKTPAQIITRNYFATIKSIYNTFDDAFKLYLKRKKTPYRMTGYNRYMSAYMKQKPSDVGNTLCGANVIGELYI